MIKIYLKTKIITHMRICLQKSLIPLEVPGRRTHTKGLYRKLDVHSKQEVIELVEARMAEEN